MTVSWFVCFKSIRNDLVSKQKQLRSLNRYYLSFEEFTPHLVLLDVNLPRFDGYYWCHQIRSKSTCPILFISARDGKMDQVDQVMALEIGSDDYITNPIYAKFEKVYDLEPNSIQYALPVTDGELRQGFFYKGYYTL